MKLLTDLGVLELLEGASDDQIRSAETALPSRVFGDPDTPAGWLEYGIKEGIFETCTFELDRQPAATVVFQLTDRRTLQIVAAHSLRPDLDLYEIFELGFRRLAAARGANRIEWETKRRGCVRKAVRAGYSICGVIMRRSIEETPAPRRTQKLQQNQGGSFGPSSSSSSTTKEDSTQTAYNEQTAVEGGSGSTVAVGSNSSGNTINVTSTDLSALQDALESNTAVTNTVTQAGVLDTAAATSAAAAASQASSQSSAISSAASAAAAAAAVAGNTQVSTTALNDQLATTAAALNTNYGIATNAMNTTAGIASAAIGGVVQASTNADTIAQSAIALSNSTTAAADTLAETAYTQFTGALDDVTTASLSSMSGLASQALSTAANATPQTSEALLEKLAGVEPATNQSSIVTGSSGSDTILVALAAAGAIGLLVYLATK